MTTTAASPERVDVAVVGGGPAGLAAAREAAAGGLSVRVFERDPGIGEPVRTSGGSFIGPLRALGLPPAYWWPVRRIRMVGPGRELVMSYRRPAACVLDVRGAYQWLAGEAGRAGADVRLRSHVDGPLADGAGRVTGLRVRTPGRGAHDVAARVVVDASGHTGVIARPAGLRTGPERSAVGVETELHAPGYDQAEALLAVGSDVAPGGYAWAFPCGRHRVRVGVGLLRPDSDADPRALLDRLLERDPRLAPVRSGAAALELHAGVMPVLPPDLPLVADGLMVVGDAAGQGSTLLGEGIRYAVLAGRAAGRVLARAERFDAAGLAGYPAAWRRAVGRDLAVAYRLHSRMAGFTDADWDRALGWLAELTPAQFAQGLAGSFTAGWAVRVLLRRPGLIGRVAGPVLAARRPR